MVLEYDTGTGTLIMHPGTLFITSDHEEVEHELAVITPTGKANNIL